MISTSTPFDWPRVCRSVLDTIISIDPACLLPGGRLYLPHLGRPICPSTDIILSVSHFSLALLLLFHLSSSVRPCVRPSVRRDGETDSDVCFLSVKGLTRCYVVKLGGAGRGNGRDKAGGRTLRRCAGCKTGRQTPPPSLSLRGDRRAGRQADKQAGGAGACCFTPETKQTRPWGRRGGGKRSREPPTGAGDVQKDTDLVPNIYF
jgi:hypothetical protein